MFSHNHRRFFQAASTVMRCSASSTGARRLLLTHSHRMTCAKFTRTYTNLHAFLRRCLYRLETRAYSSGKIDGLADIENVRGPADLSVAAPTSQFLSNLDKQSQCRVHIIRMEMEVLRGTGSMVPDQLSDHRWRQLLDLKERRERVQLYNYLKKSELTEKELSEKKEKLRFEATQKTMLRQQLPYNELEYALDRNNIMPLLTFDHMKMVWDFRLCQAMIHGPKMVLDLGFTEHMDVVDASRCVKRITFMIGYNRTNREPFDVYFCNVRPGNFVHEHLLKAFPNLHSKDILLNVTEKSYLELFSKERLVYLTADCHYNMMKYNPDNVYIIGGLDNRIEVGPVTLAKAKREGIRTARFPIRDKLNWGHNFNLPLNFAFKILLDFKNTRNWNTALQYLSKPNQELDSKKKEKLDKWKN